jgi:hypothetical protein
MQVDVENAFNDVFQAVIFKELRDVGGPLASIVPFTKLFYGVHYSFTTSMGNMKKGSPLLNHLQA